MKPKPLRAIKIWKRCFLLILFSFSYVFTFSQKSEIVFEKLTIRDGLSHNNVYSIIQDQTGFMWFGTQDGLNRYNGISFTIFRNEPSTPNSLSTGNFGKIYQDKTGIFWFGTFGKGIDRYDPKTNTFKNFSYQPNDSTSVSNNQTLFIFEDSSGTIWFGTPDGGINRYNKENETFTHFLHDPNNPLSLSSNRAKCMCQTSDGTLWIGTNNGLNRYNPVDNNFKRYFHNPNNPNSLSGNTIQNMISSEEGYIWIVVREGGLNRFDPTTETFTRYTNNPKDPSSISDNKADCILEDSYHRIWVGTYEGGLNLFDPATEKFTCYMHNPNEATSISSNRIECLYEDNSSILWIGTRGGGINKIDLKPKKFKNITHNPNSANSLPQHSIMAITSDLKGNIWIGTDGGGLTLYNPKTNDFTHFKNQPSNPNSLSNDRVWALHIDRDSVLWVGTYLGGLNRVEIKNGNYTFTRYLHDSKNPNSISHNQINYIIDDAKGNLWIATTEGLNRLVKNDKPSSYSFKSFVFSFSDSLTFVDNYINSILLDQKNRLWVGSYQSGLFEFDMEKESFKRFVPVNTDQTEFQKNLRLLCMFEDSQQNFWVGTESYGLLLFDIENQTFSAHPNNNLLVKNMVIDLIEDDEKNLWISTTRGLSKYSLTSGQFSSYTITDGLANDGFNRNAAHKASNGILYFGSNAALTYFFPHEVVNNPFKPKVSITDFKILNQSIWDKHFAPYENTIHEKGEIVLTYKDYFFSIHFASFDYTNPSKNHYKYKLEGFNEEWIEIENNTSATFTNLNHGTYTFKVKGSNNDKAWNEKSAELVVRIIPPFWKRKWFYAIEIMLVSLVIFGYIRFRTRKLIHDKKILEEKVTERTNEINAQKKEIEATLEKLKSTQIQLIQSEKMASVGILTAGFAHEVNNPLNYIQGGISALEDYLNDNMKEHSDEVLPILEMINEGVNRTAQIVRSLNRFSKSSDIHMESCNIHRIIDNCLLVLHNQLEGKVQVFKNYDDKNPQVIGNEGKLHQVFMSVIINAEQAIEKKGEITISTQTKNKVVSITISDTGCGISKENLSHISDPFFTTKEPGKGTGLGLSIVYSILREHNGAIDFESELGKGTTVRIVLPLNN